MGFRQYNADRFDSGNNDVSKDDSSGGGDDGSGGDGGGSEGVKVQQNISESTTAWS